MEGEEGARGRKRKRDCGAADAGACGSEEAGVHGYGGGCYEKELGEEDDQEDYQDIAEESVEEVMRWLETEISLASSPAAAPEKDAALGFVTINGNEESCGPSFSAAASTVMASVDTRAGAPPARSAVPWGWPSAPEAEAARGEDEQAVAAEVAEAELDEEWLVELLTGGPALEV